MKRLRALAARLALAAAAVALTLGIFEGIVRLVLPQQLIVLRPDVWLPDELYGWRHAPGLDTRVNTGEREIRLLTDTDGYRIGPAPRPEPRWRVLALGDSFLAAFQVDYADTLTARLEEQLSAGLGAPVTVVNSGVSGWDPNHYLILARHELERRPYDLVLVLLFLGNDPVDLRQDFFPPKEAEIVHTFRWPRDRSSRELKKALAYPVNDALERHSHLFTLVRQRAWMVLMRFGLSARRFPKVLLREEEASPRWDVTTAICADLDALGRAHGTPVVFAFLPGAYQVDERLAGQYAASLGIAAAAYDIDQPQRLLRERFTAAGLVTVDLVPAFRRAHAAGGPLLYGEVDTHLAPAGHALVAAELAPVLARRLQEPGR